MEGARRVRRLHRVKNGSVNLNSRVFRFVGRKLIRIHVGPSIVARRQICRGRAIQSTRIVGGIEGGVCLPQEARVTNVGNVGLCFRLLPLKGGLQRFVHRIRGERFQVLNVTQRCNYERQARLGTREQGSKGSRHRERPSSSQRIISNGGLLCFVHVRVVCVVVFPAFTT